MLALRRNTWTIVEYITSAANKLADLLSRSYDEEGNTLPRVMEEFHARMADLGLVGVEIAVTESKLRQLMPETLEACTWQQLERQSSEPWTTDPGATLLSSGVDEEPEQYWRSEALGARIGQQSEQQASESRVTGPEVTLVGSGVDEELEQQWLGGSGDMEEVERILQRCDHKKYGRQYRVRWKGFSNTRNTWAKEEDLNCPELLADFEDRLLMKGAPINGQTDAQAEQLYYGPDLGTRTSGERTCMGAGPNTTTPWMRGNARAHMNSVFTDQGAQGAGHQGTRRFDGSRTDCQGSDSR
jgi:hypothetical protein